MEEDYDTSDNDNDDNQEIIEDDSSSFSDDDTQDAEIIEDDSSDDSDDDSDNDDEESDERRPHEREEMNEGVEVEKPKKRDSSKTRINQIQREKYRALHELDQMRSENEQLKQMVDVSSKASLKQYEEGVIRRVERARQMKSSAIESGDVQAQVDADMEMSLAANEMHSFSNWKAQQQVQEQYAPQRQPAPAYVENAPILNEWVQQNQWFHPESESYDEEMADHVHNYSLALNQELSRMGGQNTIMSPQYFAEIQKEAERFYNNRESENSNGRNLNMRTVKGGASPSRGGYSNAPRQQQQLRISRDEKDMARRMGVTDKAYIQFRERDNRNSRGGR